MLRMDWSPKHLVAEMASLLDAGWAAIAYWFEQSSGQKSGFIVAGPSPSDQTRASEASPAFTLRVACQPCGIT
jgi:hypothetical protein